MWEAGFGSLYWMEGVVVRLQDRRGGTGQVFATKRTRMKKSKHRFKTSEIADSKVVDLMMHVNPSLLQTLCMASCDSCGSILGGIYLSDRLITCATWSPAPILTFGTAIAAFCRSSTFCASTTTTSATLPPWRSLTTGELLPPRRLAAQPLNAQSLMSASARGAIAA